MLAPAALLALAAQLALAALLLHDVRQRQCLHSLTSLHGLLEQAAGLQGCRPVLLRQLHCRWKRFAVGLLQPCCTALLHCIAALRGCAACMQWLKVTTRKIHTPLEPQSQSGAMLPPGCSISDPHYSIRDPVYFVDTTAKSN